MTSAELRRIVEAMTPSTPDRPWRSCGEELLRTNTRSMGGFYAACASKDPQADTVGLAALRNHADALVTLVEACERRRDLECDLPGCSGWHHTMACQKRVSDSDKAINAALADVHAVRGTS